MLTHVLNIDLMVILYQHIIL